MSLTAHDCDWDENELDLIEEQGPSSISSSVTETPFGRPTAPPYEA